MGRLPLTPTGPAVSQFCLGCMNMGTTIDRPTSFAMLDRFLERGGNFLDTANCYAWWNGTGQFVGDESESVLGEWIRARGNRDRIVLASKVGARLPHPERIRDAQGNIRWESVRESYEYLAGPTIRQSVEGSLRRLQTDHLDLCYAHIDDPRTPLEETLAAFDALVREGKVRHIACSNHRAWRLALARRISQDRGWSPYVAIQQEFSYFRPRHGADFGVDVHVDAELLDYLRRDGGVALLAYSPLLKGIYDDADKRARYYNWRNYNTADNHARLGVLTRIAGSLGVSNSQLVLAWLLHHTPTVFPLVAASSLAQLEHNLGALEIRLSTEQMQELSGAGA